MANTIPNIVIPPDTVVDIYAQPEVVAAGIEVGDEVSVTVNGSARARLYTGPTMPVAINQSTGYQPVGPNETAINDEGDKGAFIYSRLGCSISIGV